MIWLALICMALGSGLALASVLQSKNKGIKLALMLGMIIAVLVIYAVIGSPQATL